MHHSTEKAVRILEQKLTDYGVRVEVMSLSSADTGQVAMALIDAATIIMATPTVLASAHPLAIYYTYLANALRPKTKFLAIVNSYGWGGKTIEDLKNIFTNFKGELLEPVAFKGIPDSEALSKLDELAKIISQKHREIGIL
jgi:flavorubredoxin